jgi:hypothetical protein
MNKPYPFYQQDVQNSYNNPIKHIKQKAEKHLDDYVFPLFLRYRKVYVTLQ